MSLYGLNTSILSIPAFSILALLPHSYAINVASGGNALKWDNRNPRSPSLKDNLKARLDADTYAKYERAEAASANAYENIPLYAAAVIVGNIAGLPKERMSRFAAIFLTLRAAHSLVYINTKSQKWTVLRSLLWFSTVLLNFRIFYEAAKKLN